MTISVIKTDASADYSTIQAWEDACPADITAGGTPQNWEGELFNEEFLNSEGETTFGGITTDATHKLILRPVSGGGFADNADPGSDPLRFDASLGCAIRSTTQYQQLFDFGASSAVRMDIIGIQFKTTRSRARSIDNISHTQPIHVQGCLFEGAGTTTTGKNVVRTGTASGDDSVVDNSVVINTTAGRELVETASTLFNFCTFYANSTADQVRGYYDLGDFVNCLFLNSSTFQNASRVHTVDYCVTDLASWESSTATNSTLSATASNEIENDSGSAATVDLRAKSGGNCDGGGVTVSGITTDIYGQTRDGSTPTIGAFEIVASGVTGTVAVTLADAVSASAGTVMATGSGAITLGDATSTASGTVGAVTGTLAVTLENAVSSAAGIVTVTGSIAETLEDAVSASSGIVGGAVTGSASVTLEDATSATSGLATVIGASAVTLADAISAIEGTISVTGSIAVTLEDSTSVASGSLSVTGSAAVTLDNVVSTSEGLVSVIGAIAETLEDAVSSAFGNVGAGVSGNVIVTLEDAISTALGTVTVLGTINKILEDAVSSSSGIVGGSITGSASVTLEDATSSASGIVSVVGTSSITLEDATSLANGLLTALGTIATTLGDATSSASGTVSVNVTGTINTTLDGATGVASGTVTVTFEELTFRSVTVLAEDRSVTVQAEDRSVTVLAEDRSVTVQAPS